jgi:hypothetical protein
MKYIVLVLALFAFPAVCAAEALWVTPPEWDFGDVVLGESANALFQLVSDDSSPLEIYALTITDDPYSAFAITGVDPDPIPPFLFEGEFVDATVTFTPPHVGHFDAIFQIQCNDHLHEYVDIPLTGRGVSGVIPEPGSVVVWSLLGLVGLTFAVWRRKRS